MFTATDKYSESILGLLTGARSSLEISESRVMREDWKKAHESIEEAREQLTTALLRIEEKL